MIAITCTEGYLEIISAHAEKGLHGLVTIADLVLGTSKVAEVLNGHIIYKCLNIVFPLKMEGKSAQQCEACLSVQDVLSCVLMTMGLAPLKPKQVLFNCYCLFLVKCKRKL